MVEERAAKAGATLADQLVDDLRLNLKDLPKDVHVVSADFGDHRGFVRINLPIRAGYEPLRIDIGFERTDSGSLRLYSLQTTMKRGDAQSYIIGEDHVEFLHSPKYGELLSTLREQMEKYLPKDDATSVAGASPIDKPADASRVKTPNDKPADAGGIRSRQAATVRAGAADAPKREQMDKDQPKGASFEVPEFWHGKSIEELEKMLADLLPKARGKMAKEFGMDRIARGLAQYIESRKAKETSFPDAKEKEAEERSKAKAEESHHGYKRGDEVMWDRYGTGKWEKVRISDFEKDGSPVFEVVKGVMSEIGDWNRIKPADGFFGEARRVATLAEAERKKKEKQKQQSASSHIGQDLTTGSATDVSAKSSAKIIISDKKKAHEQLDFIINKYVGEKKSRGFLTEVAKALGFSQGSSVQTRYFEFEDSSGNAYTLRLSNHNVNADNHDGKTPEISIVIKSRRQQNRFHPSSEAEVTEYVYFKEDIANGDGNTLSLIAKDISDLLESGRYADTSGMAVVNHSPDGKPATVKSSRGEGRKSGKKAVTLGAEEPLGGFSRILMMKL